jgi:hypothetical protein
MNVNNTGSVPWQDKMRRLDAEWLAPQDVLRQVSVHYLEAVEWLQNALMTRSARLWSLSSAYLSGVYWRRCQEFLGEHVRRPRAVGVLRASHQPEIRCFSRTGALCHVIDLQMGRRIATYEPQHMTRVGTQDMGDGAEVYMMRYDVRDRRWKIDSFVQELPVNWNTRFQPLQPLLKSTDPHIGRDS